MVLLRVVGAAVRSAPEPRLAGMKGGQPRLGRSPAHPSWWVRQGQDREAINPPRAPDSSGPLLTNQVPAGGRPPHLSRHSASPRGVSRETSRRASGRTTDRFASSDRVEMPARGSDLTPRSPMGEDHTFGCRRRLRVGHLPGACDSESRREAVGRVAAGRGSGGRCRPGHPRVRPGWGLGRRPDRTPRPGASNDQVPRDRILEETVSWPEPPTVPS